MGITNQPANLSSNDGVADTLEWRQADFFPATKSYQGPDFQLYDMKGHELRLYDLHGSIIVLNFWATWCPPCRDEIPSLVKLQKKYQDEIVVIGISLDESRAKNSVHQFIEEMQIPYPIAVDDGRVVESYGPLSVIPTTYILDQNGDIAYYAPGYVSYNQLKEAVESLLHHTEGQEK